LPMVPRVLRSFYRQHTQDLVHTPGRHLFPQTAKVLFLAGGRGDPELFRYCQRQGIDTIEFYGSSEASIVALTPRDGWRPDGGGRVRPDVTLRLADDGEILVRSPGLMIGYYRAEELTRQALTEDGYFRTGDLGELSPDGYLRIRGRRTDAFNTP